MSDQTNSGTLVLDQLRASLDGSRYSLKAVYAAVGLSFGGGLVIVLAVLMIWHQLREVYASKPLLQRRVGTFANYEVARMVPSSSFSSLDVKDTDTVVTAGSVESDIAPILENANETQIDKVIRHSIKLKNCLKEVFSFNEQQMLQANGLDSVIYLRVLKMTRNIFAILTLLLFCTAAPINITYNLNQPYVQNLTHRDALLLLTPSLLSRHQMIPHVVLAWVSNLVVFAILWFNYRKVMALRRQVLKSQSYQSNVYNRTLMLTDVPSNLRSKATIEGSLTSMNPEGECPDTIYLGQRTSSELETLIECHCKAVRKYEAGPSGEKADEITELSNKISQLRMQTVGKTNSYAFASYTSVQSANKACRSANKSAHASELGTIRLAPPPEQILWKNLRLSRAERASKQLVVNTLYGILLLLWIVPSAFIGCFISNLSRLANVWPSFGTAMAAHPALFAVLQGFLSPSITTFVFTMLPLLFRRMSHMQGKVTRIDREMEVLRKLYAFFFLDNFFVFTVIGVVWDVVAQVLQQTHNAKASGESLTFSQVWHSLRVADRIATAIVNISSFWVMYLLRSILGLFGGSAQPMALLKRGWTYASGQKSQQTSREKVEAALPQPFQYAVGFLSILFNTTIALGFTTIQPLVLPVTLVLFILAFPVKKYELLHIQTTKYESYGLYYPLVNDITLFAVGFGNLMLLCVVWVQAGWQIAASAAPLALTVVIFKIFLYFKFDVPFYRINLEDDSTICDEGLKSTVVHVATDSFGVQSYEDPAICRPLDRPLLTLGEAVVHYGVTDPFSDRYEAFEKL